MLSRLPIDHAEPIVDADPAYDVVVLPSRVLIAPILNLHTHANYLDQIHTRYQNDPFCQCLRSNMHSIPGTSSQDGLLYVANHLVIPHIPAVRELLFRLAHDALGHFGVDKTSVILITGWV